MKNRACNKNRFSFTLDLNMNELVYYVQLYKGLEWKQGAYNVLFQKFSLISLNIFASWKLKFCLKAVKEIKVSNKNYRCNSFIVDLRHKFTVRNMNGIPVFVQSSELSNRT